MKVLGFEPFKQFPKIYPTEGASTEPMLEPPDPPSSDPPSSMPPEPDPPEPEPPEPEPEPEPEVTIEED